MTFIRMRRGRLALGAVLLAGLAILSPSRPAEAMTYEEERKLGRQVLEAIKKQGALVEDPAVNDYVNALGRKILKATGPQPFEYRFFVIDNDGVNAFAVPGGYIFLHSGTIASMESEGQLASIIAHEIAHVTSRHISQRMDANRALSFASLAGMIVGALVGGPIGTAVVAGSMGASVQAQLAYSRTDEREADIKGLDNLVAAGYDPRFMTEAFKVLIRNTWHAPKDIPTYLTTHPGLPERIAGIENMVAMHPGYGQVRGRGDDKAFQAARTRVMALTEESLTAKNHFAARLKKNSKDAWAYYGLALLHEKEQDYYKALSAMEQALKIEPANPSFLTDYGLIFFALKDFKNAMTPLSRAVVLRPNSVRALFNLGRAYEEMGVTRRAQSLYERAILQDPDHSECLYRLGVIYGRQGDLARAHLHTALHFSAEGKIDKTLYHLQKAKQNANSAPPDIQKRIDTAMEKAEKAKKKKKKKKRGAK